MYRIGQSRDIHRLEKGRKLILGLEEIPFEKGVVAHSDGDLLVHAIVEAIIGALGLGDLGSHFPDNDPMYKDISSRFFLEEARRLLEKARYVISNIDSTIIIENPKLQKYITKMRQNISEVLGISFNQVNIKATRGEGLGYIGDGNGVEALAVVIISEKPSIKKLKITKL